MTLTLEPVGKFIHEVDVRNTDNSVTKLMGVNLSKTMMPSVANINGTDLSVYKVVNKGQFACKLMSVGRDACLPIALKRDGDPVIISSAYYAFEVNDENEMLPEYLMLCFLRHDFDRELWFMTGGDVRGGVTWETFCSIQIPVCQIEEQRKIVYNFKTINDRIDLLLKLNELSEKIASLSFENLIMKQEQQCVSATLKDVATIKTGKLNSEDAVENGLYPFFTCSQETYRTNSYAFDQEAVLLAGNNASAIYPLKIYNGKFDAYQRTYVISSCNSHVSNKQIYFVLKRKLNEFKEQSNGTATKFLTMTILEPIPVLIPSEEIAQKFSQIADRCFNTINRNDEEINVLSKLKEVLLRNIN